MDDNDGEISCHKKLNDTQFQIIGDDAEPMHLANKIKNEGSRFSNCEKDQLDRLINLGSLSLPIKRPEDS